MKVRLLKQNRIDGQAGETVEVSPDRAAFLISVEAAEPVKEAREQAEKPEPKVLKKPEKKTEKEEPKVVKAAKPATKKK
ncbi:MAG: hypothetical protein IKE81_09305 [Clostridia bacterium]|nr:hypothetical protein [Clostridia bacterium]